MNLLQKYLQSSKKIDDFLKEEIQTSDSIPVSPENIAKVVNIGYEPEDNDILKNSGMKLNKLRGIKK